MNLLEVHTHLLHHLHTIAEGEDDTFLCGTHQVGSMMTVEVKAVNRTAQFTILKDALSTIAKRQNRHAVTSYRYRCTEVVHVCIAHVCCYVAMHPRIEDACAIANSEHSQACLLFSMVHMGKDIHSALGIVAHVTQHSIDHSRCACSRSNLSRIEHIQRHGIVGLVASTIRDRCSGSQSKFCGSSR